MKPIVAPVIEKKVVGRGPLTGRPIFRTWIRGIGQQLARRRLEAKAKALPPAPPVAESRQVRRRRERIAADRAASAARKQVIRERRKKVNQ